MSRVSASRDEAAVFDGATVRWAQRCRRRLVELREGQANGVVVSNAGQAQFAIVQGGVHQDLRDQSAAATVAVGFEGYAIGGLSVGEPIDLCTRRHRYRETAAPQHHLATDGRGTPADRWNASPAASTCSTCVLPTRNARNGQLSPPGAHQHSRMRGCRGRWTGRSGADVIRVVRIRGRIGGSHMAGEMSAGALNTLHNLSFYLDTMRRIRDAISFRTFDDSGRSSLHSRFPPVARFMTASFVLAMAAPSQARERVGAVLPFALVLAIFYFSFVAHETARSRRWRTSYRV